MSEKVAFMHYNFTSLLAKGLWSMYNSGKWTDVVFNCSGAEIAVHKLVMEIMAPNVMNCFFPNDSSACSIDIDESILKYLMEYIYKGHIVVSHSELEDLLVGAAKFGLKSLVDGINSYTRGLETTVVPETTENSLADDGIPMEESYDMKSTVSNDEEDTLKHLENEAINSILPSEEGAGAVEAILDESTDPKTSSEEAMMYLENEAIESAILTSDDKAEAFGRRKGTKSNTGKRRKSSKMKCNHCDFESNDKDVYSKHLLDEHKVESETFEPKKYVCYRCDFVTTEKRLVELHRQKVHATTKRVFRCQFCGVVMESYLLLGRHIQNNHSEDRPHGCPHCDYKSRTLGDLKKHMVWHVDEKVECNVCGKCLRNRLTLKSHMRVHLNQGKPREKIRHGCSLCSYSCSRKFILVNHLKTVHDVDYVEPLSKSKIPGRLASGELQCKHCDYKTKSRILFFNHLAIKHKVDEEGNRARPKFQCKMCDFKGLSYMQLASHVQWKHPKTVYRCEHCSFTTGHRFAFNNHMQNKHSNDKPFACTTCGVRCGTLANARRHALIHGNEKFVCPFCDKLYSQKMYLRKHIRIMHNTEGPTVMCSMCPFKTRTNDSLKQHVKRMHSEETPQVTTSQDEQLG